MEQTSIYEFISPKFRIDRPIRLIELFAGIGSQAKALQNLGMPYEHWRVCEIDKYAMKSYNAIFGTDFETSDIKDLHASDLGITDTDKYVYILTYSFPCQDLSLAGKQAGMTKGEGTRSGLLWEVERILDECDTLPQVLLMENVPQVVGQKNIGDFHLWRRKLEQLGYSNYVELLNAKDFGIPQNRLRCFMVSILGDYSYTFPKPIPLEKRLKDVLEDEVDEKYYLSAEGIRYVTKPERIEKMFTAGGGRSVLPSRQRDRVIGQAHSSEMSVEREREAVWSAGLKEEPVCINQMQYIQSMESQEQCRQEITKIRSRLSKTVRSSGRASYDRHSWDLIYETKDSR